MQFLLRYTAKRYEDNLKRTVLLVCQCCAFIVCFGQEAVEHGNTGSGLGPTIRDRENLPFALARYVTLTWLLR
jgi:hypothetical protein